MILRILVLVVVICGAKCWEFKKTGKLEAGLQDTMEFFEKLKQDYEGEPPTGDLLAEINYKISRHTSTRHSTTKRSLTPEQGITVLDGFDETLAFASTGIRDLSFFALETDTGSAWFAGIIDSEGLSLFQIKGTELNKIGSHLQKDYTRIIAEYCENGVLIITKERKGAIVISRLIQISGNYGLQPIQDFVAKDATDLITWHGMNQLYLGVTTPRNISIYTWLGEHFDLVQVLNFGAQKLVPFYSKGFMHVAATGTPTIILRYSLRTNTFEILQRLKSSKSISSFHLVQGHHTDHFLCLSEEFTVLYKEVQDRFMPFQKLDLASNTLAMVFGKAIVLLSLTKDTLTVYQYDGWRFVKLNIEVAGVEEIRKIRFAREEMLLMKRNGSWKQVKMSWTVRKSWKGLQDEIRQWCEDARVTAKRIPVEIPEFEGSLTILSGRIATLIASEINGQDASQPLNVLRKLEDLSSKLKKQKEILAAKKRPENLTFDSLKAKRVNVKCNTTCKVVQVKIKKAGDPFQRSKASQDEQGVLKFKYLRIKDTPTLACPLPSISTQHLVVQGPTNGQDFHEMSENVLKTRGNQIISGEHTVESMNVTGLVAPLDLATKLTKQSVEVARLKVGELNLTEGGFLLPLNGSATVMPGSIKAGRVRLKKRPFLRGSLKGLENLAPSTLDVEPLHLKNDYTLQNIVIEDLLVTSDILSESGKSINSILSNALPLGEDVPVSVEVSAKNMNWKNISLPGFKNFVPSVSQDTLKITGRKHVPRNVVVSADIYKKLKLSIKDELCGESASAPELRTSSLIVDNLTAKKINALAVIGQLKKPKEEIDFSKDRVYKKITVKNLRVETINNVTVNGTEEVLKKFEGSDLYKDSLSIENLSVNVLEGPLNFPLPPRIRKIVSKANTYVGRINGIDLKVFLDNAVTVHDTISLGNVLFEGGFSSNYTYATRLPFKLQTDIGNFVWRTRKILGDLETRSINIPQSFDYNNESAIISIQGSAKFPVEPSTQTINNMNLKELTNKTWMRNQSTIVRGSNLHLENITVDGKAIVQGKVMTPNSETWGDLGNRILSKTRLQEIKVPVSLNIVEVPFISGGKGSNVKSSVPELNDILENALTYNGPQEITGTWNFETLNITENMKLFGRVNDLNLSKDVVRHDVGENVITGRKKVLDLSAKELRGLSFDKLAMQAFTENRRKLTTIKGRKTFGTVRLQNLSVFGTVLGRRIEDALLKSSDQPILGARTIDGSVETPGLIIDGFINDVNLTEVMISQLKKRAPSQVIESDVEFLENLVVLGNVTIGFDEGRNQKETNEGIINSDESTHILESISAIKTALNNRPIYVNKFELVASNSIDSSDTNVSGSIVTPEYVCELRNTSGTCSNQAIKAVMSSLTDFILIKSISRNKDTSVVSVQRKRVSIDAVENGKDIHSIKELNIPRIEEAMVEPLKDSLWIILQLPGETLLLRYESWEELQDYVLPRTEFLHTARTPTNELLLILSDGIWKLEGSGEPRKLVAIPLKGEIQSFTRGQDFFVKSTHENHTTLLRARYS